MFSWIFRSIYLVISSRKLFYQILLAIAYVLVFLLKLLIVTIKDRLMKLIISTVVIAKGQICKFLGKTTEISKKVIEKIKKKIK